MNPEVDIDQAERIAVLETKVDALHKAIEELTALLKPMAALYQAGKLVVWVGSALLSYTHWDQVSAFVTQLFAAPKH